MFAPNKWNKQTKQKRQRMWRFQTETDFVSVAQLRQLRQRLGLARCWRKRSVFVYARHCIQTSKRPAVAVMDRSRYACFEVGWSAAFWHQGCWKEKKQPRLVPIRWLLLMSAGEEAGWEVEGLADVRSNFSQNCTCSVFKYTYGVSYTLNFVYNFDISNSFICFSNLIVWTFWLNLFWFNEIWCVCITINILSEKYPSDRPDNLNALFKGHCHW